ncbi:MAG: hypothetical protein C0625_10315 [Arcobacter sp.]|nr:MAG: hypothetical protein C0625_10315 [Arcobacter sp.]
MNQQIDKARMVYYGLFSALLSFLETDEKYENIKDTIDYLSNNPLEEYSAEELSNMKEFLNIHSFTGLKDESNLVFYSPSTTYIPTTASYYNEARDDGKKRIEMYNYLAQSKFRRDESLYKESEDSICFVFNFMNKLIEDNLNGEKTSELLAKSVFENILNEMSDLFSSNLYNHESADFYKDLALLLKVFIEFERHYYNLSKPKEIEIKETIRPNTKVKKKDSVKRAKRNLDEINSL